MKKSQIPTKHIMCDVVQPVHIGHSKNALLYSPGKYSCLCNRLLSRYLAYTDKQRNDRGIDITTFSCQKNVGRRFKAQYAKVVR